MKLYVFCMMLALAVLAPTVQAEQIGMCFGPTSVGAAEEAGAPGFEQTNWNADASVDGSLADAVDSSGTATGVSLVWDSWAARDHAGITGTDADSLMMKGYLDTNNTSVTTITISDIPYANYALVIYQDGNTTWQGENERNSIFTVVDPADDSVIVGPYVSRDAAEADFDGTFTQTLPLDSIDDATTPAGNFVVIEDLTASAIRLEAKGGYNNDSSSHPRGVVNGIQIIEVASARAHTPSPENLDDEVDSEVVGQLTWQAPLTQEDPEGDPNLVSVEQFDLLIYSTDEIAEDDPNFIGVTVLTDVTSPYSYELEYDKAYFWRVDTHVIWDSNEITGTPSTSQIVEGSVWQFSTIPSYLPPVIDSFDNVITTLYIDPIASLSATISGNSLAVTPAFALLTDDAEFPAGATASLVNEDYSDPQNPKVMLEADTAGTYKIRLDVPDAHPTTVSQIAEVVVYADACQAKKDAPSDWAANEFDKDGNCLVDMADFSVLAMEWLDDTSMKESVSYDGGDIYTLDADFYVEGEDPYSLTDANYVSEAPLEVGTGRPRINDSKDWVSGGAYISHTDPNHFITYEVEIPETGDYTVMLRNSFPSGAARSAALGTVSPDGDPSNDDIYAYGEILLSDGTDWNGYKIDSTTVNFTAGIHLVRLTWIDGDFSVDFIAFKKE